MIFKFKVTIADGFFYDGSYVERIIALKDTSTLEDLVWEILDSLDFDFDHLYEFVISGKRYEGTPPFGKESERCLVKLNSLRLRRKSKLHLWYDFGDDWMFDIVVEDKYEDGAIPCGILSSVGEAEQYPGIDDEDWDDDEGWDDEEDWDDDEDWDDEEDWDDDEDWDDEEDWDEDEEWLDQDWGYTPSDTLLETAFRYKAAKPWKSMTADDWFALKFRDGNIGYITVMGHGGEHCALGVYVGDDAFQTLRFISISTSAPQEEIRRIMMAQDCIQMVFDSKEYLRDEEIEADRAYARKHGIRLAGKNAFPQFLQYKPLTVPWHPDSEKEEQYLIEAAEATLFLQEYLKTHLPFEIGFSMYMVGGKKEIPLLVRSGDSFQLSGRHPLPELQEKTESDRPSVIPDELVEKVKIIRKKGTLQAAVIISAIPVQAEPAGRPYYPNVLLMTDQKSGLVLHTDFSATPEIEPDRIIRQFLEELIKAGCHPSRIHVREPRTFTMLEEAANRIGTKLETVKELKALDEVAARIFAPSNEQERELAIMMAEELLRMEDGFFSDLPRNMKNDLMKIIETGLLPDDLAEKLWLKLQM